MKNHPDTCRMKNGLFQIIRMEEFIRIKRVKECFSTVQVAQFIININMSLGKTFYDQN